jgi:hypothetical protein
VFIIKPLMFMLAPLNLKYQLVFIRVPEGMDIGENFDCLELLEAIYGLKQASHVWNERWMCMLASLDLKNQRMIHVFK